MPSTSSGPRRARRFLLGACLLAALLSAAPAPATGAQDAPGGGQATGEEESPTHEGAEVKVKLSGADETVPLVRRADGSHRFLVHRHDGTVEELTPEAFARRVYSEQASRGWWLRLLNITSPLGAAWVGLGLLGQVLFTGRMLLQWLVSERHRRSVVPTAFWWMSLGGASMLIIYFIWRKDAVGVLGQATGWLIYVRNLWLIYAEPRRLREVTASR